MNIVRRPIHALALVCAAMALYACAGGGGTTKESDAILTGQVRSLQAQGHRLLDRGEHQLAKARFEEARQLAESVDDLPGLIRSLNDLGAVAVLDGDPTGAIQLHQQALALAE